MSGPDDFVSFKVCKTDLTSSGVSDISSKNVLFWVTMSEMVVL